MSQQTLTFKNQFNNLCLKTSDPQHEHINDDHQQLFINKEEFSLILEKIVQKQQILQQKIQDLQMEIKSLKDVQKAFLIMKEDYNIMRSQQQMKHKIISNLKENYRHLEEQFAQYQKENAKINNSNILLGKYIGKNSVSMGNDQFCAQEDRIVKQRGNMQQQKCKKICLRKKKTNTMQAKIEGMNQIININLKDLQIAKLTSQLTKLKNKIWQYENQIAILQIQNQHLLAQTNSIYRRQRSLQQSTYNQIYTYMQSHTQPQYKTSNNNILFKIPQKISQLQQVDGDFQKIKIYQTVDSIPISNFDHKYHEHVEQIAVPITPHFSTNTLKLSYFPKHCPRHHTENINSSFIDELIEVYSQNQSDRLQSQQLFENNYAYGTSLKQLCPTVGQNTF